MMTVKTIENLGGNNCFCSVKVKNFMNFMDFIITSVGVIEVQ